jgi:hypothetical protein
MPTYLAFVDSSWYSERVPVLELSFFLLKKNEKHYLISTFEIIENYKPSGSSKVCSYQK